MLISWMAIFLLLAGCSQGESQSSEEEKSVQKIEPLKVELTIQPEKIDSGQEVTFQATVSQGGEKVEDASEVKFEIGQDGSKGEPEMLEGSDEGNGLYTVKKSFEEAGQYYVVAHVTANGVHTMPRASFIVGDGTTEEKQKHEHGEEASHHHHHRLSMVWQGQKEWKVNEKAVLETEIQLEGQPLDKADVSYEIWLAGADKPEWVNAEEKETGRYISEYTFTHPGDYKVIIHVRKDELHDHKEQIVKVYSE